MDTRLRIVNGQILRRGSFLGGHVLDIEGARIAGIRPAGVVRDAPEVRVIDARGGYIVPGLVDIHVHGGGGRDMMDLDPDALREVALFHASRGTTSIVPTTIAAPADVLMRAIEVTQAVMSEPDGHGRVLGLHLEGPYMALSRRGAHPAEHVRNPDPAEIEAWAEAAGIVTRVTVAPELPGIVEATERLASSRITVSLGHSEADYEQTMETVNAGARLVTHLYNAMAGMRKRGAYRIPGLVEAALVEDILIAEVIGDGHHVCPELMRLAWLSKTRRGMCLTTDALAAAGLPEGQVFQCGDGLRAVVSGGVALAEPERKVFAGSVITLAAAVRIAVTRAGLSPADAFTCATEVPARAVGWDDRIGQLEPGMMADVAVFDDHFRPQAVIVDGRRLDIPDVG